MLPLASQLAYRCQQGYFPGWTAIYPARHRIIPKNQKTSVNYSNKAEEYVVISILT